MFNCNSCSSLPQKARARAGSAKKQQQGWPTTTTNSSLGRSQSVSSGLDLATAAESVAERRSFFELKTSMTDVRGIGAPNNNNNSAPPVGKGLNEVGTQFLGLRYLDATYGKGTS